MKEIKIFVSYSKRDKSYLNEDSLLGFLKIALEQDGVKFWTDQMLITADDWDKVIQERIQESHIALVLVSQWFLSTPYCQNKEVKEFLRKRKKDGLIIFPIIVGPCEWQNYEWLKSLQFLPRGGESLRRNYTNIGKREELFLKILQDLRIQIEKIRNSLAPISLAKPDGVYDHIEVPQNLPSKIEDTRDESRQQPVRLDLESIIKIASYSSIIGVSTDKAWLFTFLANRILHLWKLEDFSRHVIVDPNSQDGAPSSCAMRKKKNGEWELLVGLDNKIECWRILPDYNAKYVDQLNFETKFNNLVQLKFSLDTTLLLITYLDGVDVWNVDTGANLRHFPCKEQLCTGSFYGNDQYVVAGSKNGTTFLWEMATGALTGEIHNHNELPISSILDIASGFMSAGEDGVLIICNGEKINTKIIQLGSPILCMDFDKASGMFYAALNDRTLLARNLISSVNNWEIVLPDTPTALTRVDGHYLVVANDGRTIEILDLKSGQKLATLIGFKADSWLAISPDGDLIGDGYEQFVGQGKQDVKPVSHFNLSLAGKTDQYVALEKRKNVHFRKRST
jgi:WD40 repeat protein